MVGVIARRLADARVEHIRSPYPGAVVARSAAGCSRARLRVPRGRGDRCARRACAGAARYACQPGPRISEATVAASASPGRRWTVRDLLVVGQMAVTIVLLVCAALLIRSLAASARARCRLPHSRPGDCFGRHGDAPVTPRSAARRTGSQVTRSLEGLPRRQERSSCVEASVLDQLQPHEHRHSRPSEVGRRDGTVDQQRHRLAHLLRHAGHRRPARSRLQQLGHSRAADESLS